MIDHRFAILGGLIPLIGSAGYALDTLRGRTRPNRVSWILWALAPLIAFAAELSDGVGLAGLMTLAVGVGPLLVTIASFVNERAFWRLGRFDILCGVLSLIALAMWAITSRGTVAITLSILADLLAGVPTLAKAWRLPESESVKAFLGGVGGAVVTLLALPSHSWSFANYGFPLYILMFDGALSTLLLGPRAVARRRARALGAAR